MTKSSATATMGPATCRTSACPDPSGIRSLGCGHSFPAPYARAAWSRAAPSHSRLPSTNATNATSSATANSHPRVPPEAAERIVQHGPHGTPVLGGDRGDHVVGDLPDDQPRDQHADHRPDRQLNDRTPSIDRERDGHGDHQQREDDQRERERVEHRDRVLRRGQVVGMEDRDLAEVRWERSAECRRQLCERLAHLLRPRDLGERHAVAQDPLRRRWICEDRGDHREQVQVTRPFSLVSTVPWRPRRMFTTC